MVKVILVLQHGYGYMLVLHLLWFYFQGITFEEYLSFWKFLKSVNDVDTALSFYHLAGVSIDQGMLSVVLRLDDLVMHGNLVSCNNHIMMTWKSSQQYIELKTSWNVY